MSGEQPRRILTKTVHPEWYRRYAKILNYEERTYYQPLREIRQDEAKKLKALEEAPNPNDRAGELSRQLSEARKKKIKMVLQILEGNYRKLDLSVLKRPNTNPLSAISQAPPEKVQTLFWRNRAVRPPGYVLSRKSKWRLFWENETVMEKFRNLVADYKSMKIRAVWIKAFRMFQSIYRFNQVLASIAGTTDDIFKNFRVNNVSDRTGFHKNHFRASAVGKNLDPDTMFTLSKPEHFRTAEEASKATNALRVMQTFAEFPRYLQEKICEVAWYLELDQDKMIIRQGQKSDSFYFLLAGKVATVKLEAKLQSSFHLLGEHSMGALIGSDGYNGESYREYSAYTMERCKVIAVNFSDFHRKCLEGDTDGSNAPHISFLSQLAFMKFFPMQELVDNPETNILLFYFIADSIIARDVAQSSYIYVVYKGSCKVLAEVTHKSRVTRLVHVPPFSSDDEGHTSKISSVHSLPKLASGLSRKGSPGALSRRGSPGALSRRGSGKLGPHKGQSFAVKQSKDVRRGVSPNPERTMEKFTKACGKKTIAETIRKSACLKEDRSPINFNLINAASLEKFLSKKHTGSFRERKKKDWIQFKVLREGDVIGLEGLDIGDEVTKEATVFHMVSEGAEVIMILKSFFMENASAQMLMDLRASSYIHPDETQLRAELDRRSAWRRFQNGVMDELLHQKKGMVPPPELLNRRRKTATRQSSLM